MSLCLCSCLSYPACNSVLSAKYYMVICGRQEFLARDNMSRTDGQNQHGWSADEFLNPAAPEIGGVLAI